MLVLLFLPKKEINEKLNLLNKSLIKTYWLEHELVMNNLFPNEMIVPVRKNAKYRIKNGQDIFKYIGPACNYVNEKTRNKIQKLSEKSLVKAYIFCYLEVKSCFLHLKYNFSCVKKGVLGHRKVVTCYIIIKQQAQYIEKEKEYFNQKQPKKYKRVIYEEELDSEPELEKEDYVAEEAEEEHEIKNTKKV